MTYFINDWYADLGILYEILENIEFYSGTERQKMCRHKNDNKMGSMNYGYTWKGFLKKDKNGNKINRTASPYKGLYKTKVMDDYPFLHDVFTEFQQLYFPEFRFTSVQMNKNFPCPRHIDGTNVGESILVCLGDYEGGELIVENWEGHEKYPVDNRNKMFRFNGAKYYHSVAPFTGTRYSLVFFSNKTIAKLMFD